MYTSSALRQPRNFLRTSYIPLAAHDCVFQRKLHPLLLAHQEALSGTFFLAFVYAVVFQVHVLVGLFWGTHFRIHLISLHQSMRIWTMPSYRVEGEKYIHSWVGKLELSCPYLTHSCTYTCLCMCAPLGKYWYIHHLLPIDNSIVLYT